MRSNLLGVGLAALLAATAFLHWYRGSSGSRGHMSVAVTVVKFLLILVAVVVAMVVIVVVGMVVAVIVDSRHINSLATLFAAAARLLGGYCCRHVDVAGLDILSTRFAVTALLHGLRNRRSALATAAARGLATRGWHISVALGSRSSLSRSVSIGLDDLPLDAQPLAEESEAVGDDGEGGTDIHQDSTPQTELAHSSECQRNDLRP